MFWLCKTYTKSAIKIQSWRHGCDVLIINFKHISHLTLGFLWCRSDVFIVNFEHISHLVLVLLLLTFSRQMPAGTRKIFTCSRSTWCRSGGGFTVNFEHTSQLSYCFYCWLWTGKYLLVNVFCVKLVARQKLLSCKNVASEYRGPEYKLVSYFCYGLPITVLYSMSLLYKETKTKKSPPKSV